MRLAVSTWNYLKSLGEKAHLEQAIEEIKGQGFGIELWLDWHIAPQLLARPAWPGLAKRCANPVGLSAHSALVHRFDMESLRGEIDLCAELGADPLVVHPRSLGMSAGTLDASAAMAPGDRERIAAILRFASERSVRLALENGPLDLLQSVLAAVAGLPGARRFGICLDTGHANLHRGRMAEPASLHAETLHRRLIHLHLSDNSGLEDEHGVPGDGTVEWVSLLPLLAAAGFAGLAVLELWAADPTRAAEAARRALSRFGGGSGGGEA